MVKIYGNLMAGPGKKAAEHFFPRSRRSSSGDDDEAPTPWTRRRKNEIYLYQGPGKADMR